MLLAYAETLKLFERIAFEEDFPAGVRAITPAHITRPWAGSRRTEWG